jgi:replication factor C subunit 3/5
MNITQDVIYATTGSPSPFDVQSIIKSLFQLPFSECYHEVSNLCLLKGYALSDVISNIFEDFMKLEMPPKVRSFVIIELAEVESNLSGGAKDCIQLGAVVGIFKIAMEMTAKL